MIEKIKNPSLHRQKLQSGNEIFGMFFSTAKQQGTSNGRGRKATDYDVHISIMLSSVAYTNVKPTYSIIKLSMATIFRLPQSSTIQWPTVCVVCGNSKTISGKSFGSSVDDFSLGIFLRVSENRLTLTYPICQQHQFKQRAVRIGLLFAAAIAAAIFVFLFQVVPPDFGWALWILVSLTIISLYILARVSEPVRVFGIVDDHFKIQIRNDIYAKAFATLNKVP